MLIAYLLRQGDDNGVMVQALDKNIQEINRLFTSISRIFSHDHIKDFEQLPKSEEEMTDKKKWYTVFPCDAVAVCHDLYVFCLTY